MASTLLPSILKKYTLCNKCLARQSSRRVSSIKKTKGECYICNGLMYRIDELLELTLLALEEYSYETFLIGATLPSYMLEHEDEVRARFKIKGTENVKHYLTKELGKGLTRRTGKKVDYIKPDVSVNVDIIKNNVIVRSRAIFLFGKYVKRVRGLNQKQERCNNCKGKGCSQCNNTGLSGFGSIEGIIVKKLIDAFGCESAKFAWVGGEDKESLVLNGGRPFFVKVINPKLRFARPRIARKDGVEIRFVKRVGRLPDKPLRFKVKLRLLVECECKVGKESIEKINALANTVVRFGGKRGQEVTRNLYAISAKASENMLKISMVADGGLTIKQFINGDGITPNISEIVGCKATCRSFDILSVKFAG